MPGILGLLCIISAEKCTIISGQAIRLGRSTLLNSFYNHTVILDISIMEIFLLEIYGQKVENSR